MFSTVASPVCIPTNNALGLPFTENKGEDVANYIKKRRIFANVKGKVVELVTLVLGRFSIDFRKLL